MKISISAPVQIRMTWTELKAIALSKGLLLQYVDSDSVTLTDPVFSGSLFTTVFALDGSIYYWVDIWRAPFAPAGGEYEWDAPLTAKTDFDNNYRSSSNRRIGAVQSVNTAESTVAASLTTVTLLAANTKRVGATFYNDSATAKLYVKLGTGALVTSFNMVLGPGGRYELPTPAHPGIITGVWDLASGTARIEERTS